MFIFWFYLSCVCVCVSLFQDEVDSTNPVLRDNPQLHEEVKGWLKDQKVQEIFMQGNLFILLSSMIHVISLTVTSDPYIMSILQWRLWCDRTVSCCFQVPIHWMATACVCTDKTQPPSGSPASLHTTTFSVETWSLWMTRYTHTHTHSYHVKNIVFMYSFAYCK